MSEVQNLRAEFLVHNYEVIEEALKIFTNKYRSCLRVMRVDAEDFAQDIMTNMLKRKGVENYSDGKTISKRAFIFSVAKRHLTDLIRRNNSASRKGLTLSGDVSMNEDGFSIFDLISADEDANMVLFEMIESVPDTQISKNYSLSWREFFTALLNEGIERLSQRISVSVSRLGQLEKQLYSEHLRPKYIS